MIPDPRAARSFLLSFVRTLDGYHLVNSCAEETVDAHRLLIYDLESLDNKNANFKIQNIRLTLHTTKLILKTLLWVG